uniref:Uncharacterized protein n=1 Tax=Oryza glumipatula TaxID=40148 RepID=A0A0E0BLU8_9ORYZ
MKVKLAAVAETMLVSVKKAMVPTPSVVARGGRSATAAGRGGADCHPRRKLDSLTSKGTSDELIPSA